MERLKWLMALLSLCAVAGCVTTPYGAHVEDLSDTDSQTIVQDVARQLVQLYPPASTNFNLKYEVRDGFGRGLVETLRHEGYAIQEHKPSVASASTPNSGTSLAYILDRHHELFRISIMADDQRLSRAYLRKDNVIHPAGHWVRQQ
ncbi:hypothetical protein [Nitrosomonas communis]|uniref:hypothetical protein n=1 Tax=Nitrosomonas communis TaxID=44574 RepID=UPI003D2B28DE